MRKKEKKMSKVDDALVPRKVVIKCNKQFMQKINEESQLITSKPASNGRREAVSLGLLLK